jgi:hypothetical protein
MSSMLCAYARSGLESPVVSTKANKDSEEKSSDFIAAPAYFDLKISDESFSLPIL